MKKDEARNELEKLAKAIGMENADEAIDSLLLDESLTEEDLDSLVDTMSGNISEANSRLREIIGQNMMDEKRQAFLAASEEELGGNHRVELLVDPVTGLPNPASSLEGSSIDAYINQNATIDTMFVDPSNMKEDDFDTFKSGIMDNLNIDEKDAMDLFYSLIRIRREKPKKLFKELPESIQNMIANMNPIIHHKTRKAQALEEAASMFIYGLENEVFNAKAFDDFNVALKNTLENVPDEIDMYLDNLKNVMEVKNLEQADKLESEGKQKQAGMLRAISKTFPETYQYTTLMKKIKNKRNINAELTKDLKNFDEICKKFNARYKHTKVLIKDVRLMLPILDRKLPEDIHIDSIKKFIILFCNISRKLDPTDVVDHTFMHYTVNNIICLDHIDAPKSQIVTDIITNVTSVIKAIEEN